MIRTCCLLLLLALGIGSPAAAAPKEDKATVAAPGKAPAPAPGMPAYQVPVEISDPATMARMASVLSALARAVLDMPVGEVQAAIEGRTPSAADKGRTVREVAGAGDPDFERRVQSEIAESQGMMQAGLKAMVTAMPAIVKAMNEAGAEVEKAVANLPRPDYPRR